MNPDLISLQYALGPSSQPEQTATPKTSTPAPAPVVRAHATTLTQAPPKMRTAPPPKSAIEIFNSRVESLVANSIDRKTAIRKVVQSDAELHTRYLAEINVQPARPTIADPITKFSQLVAEARAGGLSYSDAVRQTVRKNSDLHLAYVRAINS